MLIFKAYNFSKNRLSIERLCRVAKVSRSGFYDWLKRDSNQEKKDLDSFKTINKVFQKHNQKIGIRPLKMYIERDSGEIFNLKRIARIKSKFGLVTKKRKK